MSWRDRIQSVVDTLYPATCLSCDTAIEGGVGLCGACWLSSPFISGLVCETCGTPLVGTSHRKEFCDACLEHPRPWAAARGVFLYEDRARKLVWDLKYADRPEVAKAAGKWLLSAGREIFPDTPVIIPVPLHWTRLLKRKYNQSELLARALAEAGGFIELPNGLKRIKRTPKLFGLDKAERDTWMQGAIRVRQEQIENIEDQNIVLVDDVMTTGATLCAATEACFAVGARSVSAVFLARASKND